MAERQTATAALSEAGAGVAVNVNLMAILSCFSAGAIATVRRNTKVQDAVDEFVSGEGLDLLGHHSERNRQQTLVLRMATATAGTIGPVDSSGVNALGSMVLSGTPVDDEEIAVEVMTGGVVGTAGIKFRYSRDGGRTWRGNVSLGTGTSFPIPTSGITVTFAGTLEAGDILTARCWSPKWDADGLAACFTAIKAQGALPRLVHICGDVSGSTEVQAVIDEIEAYESAAGRHSQIVCSLRDRYSNAALQKTHARMSGAPTDLDFVASADTLTRNTGSWVTDGFIVGQEITIAGTASNNGTHVLTAVSATVLTVGASPGLVDESNVNGSAVTITGAGPGDVDFVASGFTITRNIGSWVTDGFKVGMVVTVDGSASNDGTIGALTAVSATVLTFAAGVVNEASVSGRNLTITAEEPRSSWRAAIELLVAGATPTAQKVSHKVSAAGGRARRRSPINNWRKRRPASWPYAIRVMGHDVHVSAAKVESGPLEGWDIFDENGILEEHDERVDGGLLAARILCLTTYDDFAGCYVALPVTLDEDNLPLSRAPNVAVGQLACRVAQRAYTLKLGGDVDLKANGTIREDSARRIDGYVRTQLEINLMQRGPEGTRASAIESVEMSRDIDLRVVGATVPWEVKIQTKGYIEKLTGTVRVGG